MFSGDKIDDNLINHILDNANWAPNHKKTEPWRFIVFKEKGLDALSEFCGEAYKASKDKDSFSQIKYDKTKKKVLQSSHVIAIVLNRSTDVVIPEWEEIAAVSAAVQNMWLTAHAYGLAGYWSTPSFISMTQDFLNLKDHQRCMGFFYLGIKDPNIEKEGARGSISEKVNWRIRE